MHSIVFLPLCLLASFSFLVEPSSCVTSDFTEREKAQCPTSINRKTGGYRLTREPYEMQKKRCILYCRTRTAFYFTIDPWKCTCFATCYNMYNVDAKYSLITGNTEYKFDPNNIGAEGYFIKKSMTCPPSNNGRLLQKAMKSEHKSFGYLLSECKYTCHFRPRAVYYEMTEDICSCFETCNGIKPSDSNQSSVGLLIESKDPSLISVDRIY